MTWPDGKYGLLKPVVGCPNTEFTWNEGSRDQDTEDKWADNGWSFYMPLVMDGVLDMNWIRQKFCIKTVSNVDERSHWQWQPGSYCIYKYGDSCPQGKEMNDGWMKSPQKAETHPHTHTRTLRHKCPFIHPCTKLQEESILKNLSATNYKPNC